jgi:hypothetical protein
MKSESKLQKEREKLVVRIKGRQQIRPAQTTLAQDSKSVSGFGVEESAAFGALAKTGAGKQG